MGLFFKKSSIAENRIENSGRWPVRLTNFHLIDEYEFPATNFPEVFVVQEGSFLHETDAGTQALREGSVFVVNPGVNHVVKQPEEVILTRVRYLPEWLAQEYQIVINSPALVSLFFDQSWFRVRTDEKLHVFSSRTEMIYRIRTELDYLKELLRDKRQLEPVARVAVLKLMSLLSDEHVRFWRGAMTTAIPAPAKHALDEIEATVISGEPFELSKMPRGGFEKAAIESTFEETVGMGLATYAERRRAFHAACLLLTTTEEPRRVSKDLGFPTTGEFNRAFETVFDVSPSIYRQKFGMTKEEATPTEEA